MDLTSNLFLTFLLCKTINTSVCNYPDLTTQTLISQTPTSDIYFSGEFQVGLRGDTVCFLNGLIFFLLASRKILNLYMILVLMAKTYNHLKRCI